ncbi:MAG: DUF4167 domain-containing protein [Stellaceae bacterium]
MRSGGDQRPRGRPYANRPSQPRQGSQQNSQNFSSNGPSGSYGSGDRIRGNPPQLYQRYLVLAQDAARSEDRIAAEGFYQHAEHYYRVSNAGREPVEASPAIDRNARETGPAPAEPGAIDGDPHDAAAGE